MISLGWFQYTRLFSGKENELWDGQSSTSHWVRGERYQYFGARYYDPVACSWTGEDPLAEKYYGITPYVYCAGDPVNYEDLFGKSWRPIKSYNSKGIPASVDLITARTFYLGETSVSTTLQLK